MNPTWIAQRLSLSGLAHRIDDVDAPGEAAVVLRREALDVVRGASDVMGAARAACAARLRAARERERRWRHRARARAEALAEQDCAEVRQRALGEAAALAAALSEARAEVLAAAEGLVLDIAREAARRLLLELPPDIAAHSSARQLLDEWRAARDQDEPRLHVHPDDLVALEAFAAEAGWPLLPDPALARGHCVLFHAAGSLHANYGENARALMAAIPSVASVSSVSSVPPTTPKEISHEHEAH